MRIRQRSRGRHLLIDDTVVEFDRDLRRHIAVKIDSGKPITVEPFVTASNGAAR